MERIYTSVCTRHRHGYPQVCISGQAGVVRRDLGSLRLRRLPKQLSNDFLELRSRLKSSRDFCINLHWSDHNCRFKRIGALCSASSENCLAAGLNPEDSGIPWDRIAQIAIILAATICWYWISKDNAPSPFLSLTASVSGVSKEGLSQLSPPILFIFDLSQLFACAFHKSGRMYGREK
jgi:hypothetical protein